MKKRPTGRTEKRHAIRIVHRRATGERTFCGIPVVEVGAPGRFQTQEIARPEEEVSLRDECQTCRIIRRLT